MTVQKLFKDRAIKTFWSPIVTEFLIIFGISQATDTNIMESVFSEKYHTQTAKNGDIYTLKQTVVEKQCIHLVCRGKGSFRQLVYNHN